MSIDDRCLMKKIVEKDESFEFYKIGEPKNVLNNCYYHCDGKKLVCQYKTPTPTAHPRLHREGSFFVDIMKYLLGGKE